MPITSLEKSPYLPLILGSALLIAHVAHMSIIEFAANPDGTFPFHESSAVFVTEFGKLALAGLLLGRAYIKSSSDRGGDDTDNEIGNDNGKRPDGETFKFSQSIILKMAVPGLLYSISNILAYSTTGLLGSTNYQLFSNMKVIITAVVFRLVMEKKLKVIQWFSLILLTIALLVASDKKVNTNNNSIEEEEGEKKSFTIGLILMVVASFCAAGAGIYSEFQLKNAKQHPMLQNLVLYFWSCLFCAIKFTTEARPPSYDDSSKDGIDLNSSSSGFTSFFVGFSTP